jgi:hypothetical protein
VPSTEFPLYVIYCRLLLNFDIFPTRNPVGCKCLAIHRSTPAGHKARKAICRIASISNTHTHTHIKPWRWLHSLKFTDSTFLVHNRSSCWSDPQVPGNQIFPWCRRQSFKLVSDYYEPEIMESISVCATSIQLARDTAGLERVLQTAISPCCGLCDHSNLFPV